MSRLFANNGRLDGVIDYPSNQCTFGAWVKRGASATDMVMHFGTSGSPDGFYIQVSSAGVVQGVISAAGSAVAANASLAINDTTTWHLVTATIQDTGGGALKVTTYVDGANPGTQVLTRTPALATVVRIAANLNGTGFLTGRTAHPYRYNVLLTPTEILALYTNIPEDIRRDALIFYDALTQDRNPELDDIGGVELAITNATYDTDNPAIGPPTILSVGTVQQGESLTITGVGFTTPTVTIGGVEQTVDSSSDTSATIDAVTIARYGQLSVVVTNTRGLTDTLAVPAIPASGFGYVDLVAPLAPVGQRFTTTPTDLQGGWQAEYELPGLILSDGSAIGDVSDDTLSVRVNDGSGYGSSGVQTREDPSNPPVLTGILPPVVIYLNAPAQISVADGATGWTSVTEVSAVLAGLGLTLSSLGIITGTPNAAGAVSVTIRYTNSGDSVDAAPFALEVIGTPVVLGVPPNLRYRTHSGEQVVNLAQYFADATDYIATPPFPLGWLFVGGVLTIPDITVPAEYGPFMITGTNPAGGESLTPFAITYNEQVLETVPYLIEDTLLAALARIAGINCLASVTGSTGSVTAQDPPHMSLVARGTTISITLGGAINTSRRVNRSRGALYGNPP